MALKSARRSGSWLRQSRLTVESHSTALNREADVASLRSEKLKSSIGVGTLNGGSDPSIAT